MTMTNATQPASRLSLFSPEEEQRYRSRWESIQASFVEEPREAVEHADDLVADIADRIAEAFRNERAALEALWERNGETSIEDLRACMQRYREQVDRLLAVGP